MQRWVMVSHDHWTARDSKGRPISLKRWPMAGGPYGLTEQAVWILCRRWEHSAPCVQFSRLDEALGYLGVKGRRS